MTEQQADLIAVDPDIVGVQAHVSGIRAAAAYGAVLAREEIFPLPA